jgi:hypothetical protein
MKLDIQTIITLASYAVAGVVLISLVATNPVQVGILAGAAGAYFIANKVL